MESEYNRVDASISSLESILCTEELQRRPSRRPNFERESRALVSLAQTLADSPRTILQALADTILEVCDAGSAGISLLTKEDGGKRFFWPAISGEWKPHIGGGTPRDFGPCGDVLDRNMTLLFSHVERRYTYFEPVTPKVEEALLIPFYANGKAAGTIWAVSHDSLRKFDAEDERIMGSLGSFASSAYQILESLDDLKLQATERGKAEAALRLSHAELETVVEQRTAALRMLTVSLLRSQDEERRRFARNLHDSLGQYLTILKINLDVVNKSEQNYVSPEVLSECLHVIDECLNETRTISHLLHPPLLDEAGFASAARWYVDGFAKRGGMQATLTLPEAMDRLPMSVELALFRILQESLTNVHRHSASPSVEIAVLVDAESVTLSVKDAGRGVPEHILKRFREKGTAGIGLAGMRERVIDLGGTLHVDSNEMGTLLMATIPLNSQAESQTEEPPARTTLAPR